MIRIGPPVRPAAVFPRLLKPTLILFPVLLLILIVNSSAFADIRLAWDPVTNAEVSGYRLYVGTNQTCRDRFADCTNRRVACDTAETTCTVGELSPGRTYYFSITAYNRHGRSAFSEPPVSYYAPYEYTVTATASNHGRVSPSGDISVMEGNRLTLRFYPDSGYRVADVLVNCRSMGPLTTMRLDNVQSDKRVTVLFESNKSSGAVFKPVPVYPENGSTNASPGTTLEVEGYYNQDQSRPNEVTYWQVATGSNFSTLVFEKRCYGQCSDCVEDIMIPAGVLTDGQKYHWRARFTDDRGRRSVWSESFTFTATESDGVDLNFNGIPDQQEVTDPRIDLDRNGTPDIQQSDARCITLDNGGFNLTLVEGDNVAEIESLAFIDSVHPFAALARSAENPGKLISFRLRLNRPGVTAVVTLFCSWQIDDDRWSLYDSTDGWQDFTEYTTFNADGSVTLRIQDGGPGDADGSANRTIVHSSGPGEPVAAVDTSSDDSGGGSAGCFIATAAYGSDMAKEVVMLKRFRDDILMPTAIGKQMVRIYYRTSPPLADVVRRHRPIRTIVRWMLVPITVLGRISLILGPAATYLLVMLTAVMAGFGLIGLIRKSSRPSILVPGQALGQGYHPY